MRPYYEHAGITIYHGDCREVLPLVSAEAIITDPVWPNCEHIFPGINASALLGEALAVADVRRAVIQLGVNSDPRFLQCVPAGLKYLRTCYLEYAVVGYLDRIMRDCREPPPPRGPVWRGGDDSQWATRNQGPGSERETNRLGCIGNREEREG